MSEAELAPGPGAPRPMAGRVAMVTGANTGIGREVALALARQGATVVLVCRSQERGSAVLEEVRVAAAGSAGSASPTGGAELLAIDLASFASIRAGAADFLSRHDRLHVLVNNAGVFSMRRRTTADGHELTFGVNQLAPFLLTHLLRPILEAAAPARIVNVASAAHHGARMQWDDLQFERSYSGRRAYNQSKLANILFTAELARRLAGTGVVANSVHPGVVATDLVRGAPFPVRWAFRLLGLTPARGAEGPVLLATAPHLAATTGRYFSRTREATPSRAARDPDAATRLWGLCEQLTAEA